jgi:subtilisin family serine protease
VFAVLVGVWIAAVTAGGVAIGWIVDEAFNFQSLLVPGWFAPTGAVFGGLLTMPPAAILVALSRQRAPYHPGTLAAGRAWLLASSAGVVLGCVRATPLPQNEVLLGLTALAAGAVGFAVRRLPVSRSAVAMSEARPAPAGYLGALGLAMLAPWAAFGALGSLAETVLAILLAAAVGYLVTGIITPAFLASFQRSRPWQVLTGGLATAVALGPVAAALGGPGVNVAEVATVPLVGFAVGAVWWFAPLAGRPRRPNPLGVLIALAVFGPVAFVDPEETSLVLGIGDVGTWAAYAAGIGALVALALGLAYAVNLQRPVSAPRRWIPSALASVMLAGAVLAYVSVGHPGFYGEKLFVVMSEQADLSGLSAITDITRRREATYQRLVQTADRTQAGLRHELESLHLSYTPYYLVNGVLVDAGPAVRPLLSRRSDVDRVLYDQRMRPLPQPAPGVVGTDPAPGDAPQWNIQAIGAPSVWASGDTGQGITVGTSDTGVDGTHPLLAAGYRGGDDSWYDPWNATATPTDHIGHGTHTIGTAVGRGGIGVAPGAHWMGCVDLDRDYGSPSHYLNCLQFMLAPFPLGGNAFSGNPARAADILTNSWGCPAIEGCDLDALRPATAALAAAGIYTVVAAGNDGPDCDTVTDAPSPYPDVLTVGAAARDGTVASFSSRGPTPDGQVKPDLVAPGVDVLSALPHGTYGRLEGTSMATPHVAGVVALMWSANPKLIGDIGDTTRILRQSATRVKQPATDVCGSPQDITGAGQVDAAAAVALARTVS